MYKKGRVVSGKADKVRRDLIQKEPLMCHGRESVLHCGDAEVV